MLPDQLTDRRQPYPGPPDFDDSVRWHLLLPISPVGVLASIFEAAQAATDEVTSKPGITSTDCLSWVPM